DRVVGEAGVEARAGRARDAVLGPRAAPRREGDVAARGEVLGRHHRGEGGRPRGDRRDDLIAAWHGQRAPGQEVRLHVHDEQRVVFGDAHGVTVTRTITLST